MNAPTHINADTWEAQTTYQLGYFVSGKAVLGKMGSHGPC